MELNLHGISCSAGWALGYKAKIPKCDLVEFRIPISMQFRKCSDVTEAFASKSFVFFRSSDQSSPASLLSTDSQSWKLPELRKDVFVFSSPHYSL